METLQNFSLAILSGMWTLLVWTWWIIVPIIWWKSRKNLKKAEIVVNTKHVTLGVKIPKNNDKGPIASEMMFAALHGILQPKDKIAKGLAVQEHLSFEIVSTVNAIEFFVWAPEHLKDFVEGQIYAQYPTAEISTVKDYTLNIDIDGDNKDDCVAGTELSLVKDEIYPIKTFQNFDVDPLAGITGMLSKIEGGSEKVWIQILAKPVDEGWRGTSLGHISVKKGGKTTRTTQDIIYDVLTHPFRILPDIIANVVTPLTADEKKKVAEAQKKEKEKKEKEVAKLSHAEETELSAIEEKSNKLGYKVMIRVVYLAKSKSLAQERVKAVFGAFKQFNTNNLNGFQAGETYTGTEFLNAYRARFFNDTGFILNIEELASLYHLPHVSVETPNIVWTSSKKGEPPANIPLITEDTDESSLTTLGLTTFRGQNKVFGIKRDDRRRHIYVIGKSGTGKSKLLETLVIKDIKNGEGVAFVDPHGDSAETILKFIPKDRIDDVIYFNPADRDYPIAFNPLEANADQREEIANGFVSVLKKLFGYSWGPRLEYVLKHTVLALVEAEGSTMLGIVRMLTDKNYRKKIVEQITDPVVQMFWLKEFSTYNDKMATETVAPILNKVGQFTSSPIIRNIVGQPISNFDFAKAMNEGKIMIFNLSTGLIGEENAKLLGSMVVTKLQLAAMSRAKIPEEERRDFYLYVDEFQNFATDSFAVILSEARKYRLSLTVANQYIAQMDETVRDAVFGNVGTLISFRVGAGDAAALEKEFQPTFEQNDLINLDNQHIYLTMLIDGVSSQPFSAMTVRRPDPEPDNASQTVIAVSRMKYGTPLAKVEESIRHWYNVDSVVAGINANEKDRPIVLEKDKQRESTHTQQQPKAQNQQPKTERTENQKEIVANAIKVATKGRPKFTNKKDLIAYLEDHADFIVRHKDKDDKYVFLPENMPAYLLPDPKGRKKGTVYRKRKSRIYDVKIDMYVPFEEELFGVNKAPDIWVGTFEDAQNQLEAIKAGKGGATKFIGIEKRGEKKAQPEVPKEPKKPSSGDETVSLRDKLDKETIKKLIQDVVVPQDKAKESNTNDNAKKVTDTANDREVKAEEIGGDTPLPTQTFDSNYNNEKVIKEITPQNFHEIKTIHPHEKVKISASSAREIKPGETVKFD